MGLVKRLIEDLTYAILQGCGLEDTENNYSKVFSWVMEQDYVHKTHNELTALYRKEFLVTPVIWGGPLWRDAFNEHDVVFIKELNRRGTIVSGPLSPGTYGLEQAVLVEFQSGKGLPGNDPVQTVPTSQLKKAG